MASPSLPERTYHVFLSFRGVDVRNDIVSQLHEGLDGAGIYTFLDSVELDKGDRIDKLLSIIEDSSIALIVFSKLYATSKWCLKELTKAMECQKTGLLVLPVFFEVETGEVKGTGGYKTALDGYETECKNGTAEHFSLNDVNDWRKALGEAAGLSGWVYKEMVIKWLENGDPVISGNIEFKNKTDLVKIVVQYISKKLEREPLYVGENIVDMLSQVEDVKSILDMRPANEAHEGNLMVGLWGMGCLGKSTLARLIYNSIFKEFERAAFIEFEGDSTKSVQETMLNILLRRANLRVANRHEGIATITKRLQSKRVLLILDGAENIGQIDKLIGMGKNFLEKGSKIIITTRNQSLLRKRDAIIYEVKPLEDHEARQLLCNCASKNGEENIREDLVKRALQCTGRLPSALRALGSHFRDNGNDVDRDKELEIFGTYCDQVIHKELVKSLHGLDDPTTEDIFLDIACFFNGWNRKYVEGFLTVRHVERLGGHSYDIMASKANKPVKDLVDGSLITDDNGTLQVHPLIELMGRKEAGGEYPRGLKERHRLWRSGDVAKVLSDKRRGYYAVQAIVLGPEEPLEMETIDPEAFERLEELRFLIITNAKVGDFRGCIHLPQGLKWFDWPDCPASSLKFSPAPLNPTVLAVRKNPLLRNRGNRDTRGCMVFGSIPRELGLEK